MIDTIITIAGVVLFVWFVLPYFTFRVFNSGCICGIILSIILISYGCLFDSINSFFIKMSSESFGRIFIFVAGFIVIFLSVVVLIITLKMIFACYGRKKCSGTVIVLGCRVGTDGPSHSLESRLITAFKLLSAHKEMKCILSGGKGDDEPISEAEFMFNYLVSVGIEKDRLYLEDRSTSTKENIKFSLEVAKRYNLCNDFIIVTNNFHLYRALAIAGTLGIDCSGCSSRTHPVLLPSYYVRELLLIAYYFLFRK